MCCFFFYSGQSIAAPNPGPLPESTYITWNNLDWTWASCVSISTYYSWSNIVSGPDFHDGWRSATSSEWNDFLNLPGSERLGMFTRDDGSFIHSAAYWNSDSWFQSKVDNGDMWAGSLKTSLSAWNSTWDLVYVRTPNTVPIPSSLFLLGGGLLGIAGVSRKKKK